MVMVAVNDHLFCRLYFLPNKLSTHFSFHLTQTHPHPRKRNHMAAVQPRHAWTTTDEFNVILDIQLWEFSRLFQELKLDKRTWKNKDLIVIASSQCICLTGYWTVFGMTWHDMTWHDMTWHDMTDVIPQAAWHHEWQNMRKCVRKQ